MMPYFTGTALPWFERYGATLNDATSFRIVIKSVELEAAEIRRFLPEYQRAGFADIVAECETLLEQSDAFLVKLRARLAEILN